MYTLKIDQANFLKGMSLSDYSGDKGFSPLSKGFEVDRRANLGLLASGRGLTEYNTNLSGNIIAKTKYKKSGGSFSYYLISDTAKIFETNAVTLAHTLKDTATGKTFSAGISSVLVFLNELFITSTDDIYRDDFTFTVKDKTWWTATKGKIALTAGVPHKLFEFNAKMFILNGNKIASWDGTTAEDAALTLPTGWIITDAVVDNDLIYLTIVKNLNDYASYTETKIIVWNSFTTITWTREVNVFTPAISAIVKADQGFIFWASRDMYFFDGYNYQWLRYVESSPNFNQVEVFNGNIYFSASQGVASYNTRLKIYTHPLYYTGNITAIGIAYIDYIDIFTDTAKMLRGTTSNYAGSTFISNWYNLNNAVIRKIVYGFSGALATGSSYTINIIDESTANVYSDTITKVKDGAKTLVVRSQLNTRLSMFQFRMAFDNAANLPLRFIHIYYEPSETYVSK
jgi:hypothetical protein